MFPIENSDHTAVLGKDVEWLKVAMTDHRRLRVRDAMRIEPRDAGSQPRQGGLLDQVAQPFHPAVEGDFFERKALLFQGANQRFNRWSGGSLNLGIGILLSYRLSRRLLNARDPRSRATQRR